MQPYRGEKKSVRFCRRQGGVTRPTGGETKKEKEGKTRHTFKYVGRKKKKHEFAISTWR